MDKLLEFHGTQILKSRIVGWRRSYMGEWPKRDYAMDIILDSGNHVTVFVSHFDYDYQADSLERAEQNYEVMEKWLNEEFNVE